MKEEREALIAQKRQEEKSKLQNHYGKLKFKPNIEAIEAYDINKQIQKLANNNSADSATPKDNNGSNGNNSIANLI